MNLAKALVLLMAFESFGASIAYAYQGNFKLAAYWFFASGINAAVSRF